MLGRFLLTFYLFKLHISLPLSCRSFLSNSY
nr:MAG TPA: hypothetical protein [Caudoviricetes sp.]